MLGIAVYLLRLSGFAFDNVHVPDVWTLSLTYVPVATLTALVVTSIDAKPDELPVRMLAAVGAGAVVWRTGRMWLCIVTGMGLYLLLRLI